MAGYQQERLDRTSNGGVVFSMSGTPSSKKRRLDVPTDDLELICIKVQPPKSKSFLVLACYRPPSNPFGSFSKLEMVLSFLKKTVKK